ncbi:hypothetical protein [Xylella fastidiosa]|nr:hypothetical protein [Xylella fastidiosa]
MPLRKLACLLMLASRLLLRQRDSMEWRCCFYSVLVTVHLAWHA